MRKKSRRAVEDDPMVDIDGERVRDALRWRGISVRDAANRLNDRAGKRIVSQQSLNDIVRGTTKRCHSTRRDALTRLIGRPITAAYLGGQESLVVPALRWPPSATPASVPMPIDMIGVHGGWTTIMPPAYELAAMRLGNALIRGRERERRNLDYPIPDLRNAARYLLSLAFWREFLFDDQRHGAAPAEMRAQSAAFAHHLSEAARVLLAPWVAGNVTVRRNLLARILSGLDHVASINEDIHGDRSAGRVVNLAIRDMGTSAELVEHFRKYVRDLRQKGVPEAEIARQLYEWPEAADAAT